MPLGEHAVDFMERTIAASPRPVTLVPTGPLTNIALLLERTGGANVERIVSMGGAIAEGNMTPGGRVQHLGRPRGGAGRLPRRASTRR